MIKRVVKPTGDGSHTLYQPDLNESYHSVNGAVTESNHVFIQHGLLNLKLNTVRIFEVGFGTGLNTILSLIKASELGLKIIYHTIEKYPLELEIIHALNYTNILPQEFSNYFNKIHQSPWNTELEITDFFTLKKIKDDLPIWQADNKYHLIYFDAFGPDKQPEMWTKDVFQKMHLILDQKGILVTYSCKGDVRRNLQSVGFDIEKLPGPPGKRHMLRAVKN